MGDGDGGGEAALGGVAGLDGLALAGVVGLVETSRANRLAVSSGIQASRGLYGPSLVEATAWLYVGGFSSISITTDSGGVSVAWRSAWRASRRRGDRKMVKRTPRASRTPLALLSRSKMSAWRIRR